MTLGRVALGVLVVLALCAARCGAVDMEVTLGFDGSAKNSYWTPIAVTLHNKGGGRIVGTLSAAQQDFGTRDLPTYSANVVLPPHSRKLYHLYARLAEYGGDVTVALSDDSGVIVNRKVPANTCASKDVLIVSVGPRTMRPNYLMGDTVKIVMTQSTGSGQPRRYPRESNITVGSIDQTRLPDRPAALEGVNCLILSDFRPSAVERKALSALSSWVASGGILVVATGPDYRKFTHSFYEELLPVRIEGAANVPGLDSLSSVGKARFPAGPVAVCRAVVKPNVGRTVASQNGLPIVAVRNYGAGQVVFVAVDHLASPFKDWSGQTAFWKSLISRREPGSIACTQGLSEELLYAPGQPGPPDMMAGVVAQDPSIEAPSYTMLVAFLAAYLLVLAPLNYAVLRRKRRLELAWVTTPAIVLLFSIGAYAIGWTIKGGGLKLCEATVIESSSDARYARAVTVASLFSPAKRRYDVEVRDPSAVCQVLVDVNTFGEHQPKTIVGRVSVIDELPVHMWSSKSFQSVGGTDLGGRIVSQLVTDGRSVSGSIRNDTNVPLTKCCLVYGGNKVELRDLPCGGSVDTKVKFLRSQIASDYTGEHPSLARKLREGAIVRASGLGVPVLIGVAQTDRRVFGLSNESPQVDAATVCVFRLDYTSGRTFSFGPDQIAVTVNTPGSPQLGEPTGAHLRPGQTATFTYRIPIPEGARIRNISVKDWPRSGISSSILNRLTGKWEPLGNGAISDPTKHLDASSSFCVRAKSTGKRDQNVGYTVNASGVRE